MSCKNLIFDLGGVLMMHNLPGCIRAFRDLMGEDGMARGLGLLPNGEGVPNSLMARFELGLVDEDTFIATILRYAHSGTTRAQVEQAWMTMHAGIPQDLLERVRQLGLQGHHLLVLSNNNPLHARDVMQHYDLSCFQQVFFSHQVHACKPDLPIYTAVADYLRQQHWDGLETWFTDDIAANRAVGERMGWHTASSIDDLEQQLRASTRA